MRYAKPYIILPKTAKFLNISRFYTHLSPKKVFSGTIESQTGRRVAGTGRGDLYQLGMKFGANQESWRR